MRRLHWGSVALGFGLVLGIFFLIPAPEGCGCAERKRKLLAAAQAAAEAVSLAG